MNRPRVSAVIIFLDAEAYLEEAIRSVLGQSYADWELILVDDGSRDGSSRIARDHAARSPERIRYARHDDGSNRGMSASRNLGVRFARGDYVAFLDSDDVWLPTKLEEQVTILEAEPRAGALFGATEYWHSWTGAAEDQERDKIIRVGEPGEAVFGRVLEPPELLLRLYPLGRGCSPSMSGFVARREVFAHVGGFEEAFRDFYEDQAFLAKLYLEVPVILSPLCWDRYRQHPASCVAREMAAGSYHRVRKRFLLWFGTYLAKSCHATPEVRAAWLRASRTYRHPIPFALPRFLHAVGRRLLAKVLPFSWYVRLRTLVRAAGIVT